MQQDVEIMPEASLHHTRHNVQHLQQLLNVAPAAMHTPSVGCIHNMNIWQNSMTDC